MASPLDCAWIQSNNCYKTALAAAEGCLPPTQELGLFDATGTSCAYDGGDTIEFSTPATYPLPQMLVLDFTVLLPDGGLCLSFQEPSNGQGFTLRTPAGVVTETTGLSLTVVCPDGTTFSTGDAFGVLGCDGGLTGLPGDEYGYSPVTGDAGAPLGSLNYSFTGVAGGQLLPVFSCFAP